MLLARIFHFKGKPELCNLTSTKLVSEASEPHDSGLHLSDQDSGRFFPLQPNHKKFNVYLSPVSPICCAYKNIILTGAESRAGCPVSEPGLSRWLWVDPTWRECSCVERQHMFTRLRTTSRRVAGS